MAKFREQEVVHDDDVYHIQEMSAKDRQDMFKLYGADTDPIILQATYVQKCCREFSSSSMEDILIQPGSLISKLSDEISRLSGLTEEAYGDAEKN